MHHPVYDRCKDLQDAGILRSIHRARYLSAWRSGFVFRLCGIESTAVEWATTTAKPLASHVLFGNMASVADDRALQYCHQTLYLFFLIIQFRT